MDPENSEIKVPEASLIDLLKDERSSMIKPEEDEAKQNPVKDNEGFLAPPPASTLLIRRARTNSTGAPTYVVASSNPALLGGSGDTGKVPPVKRRPGRPVGSIGSYKKKRIESTTTTAEQTRTLEVRVSSRMSTSVFKHDSNNSWIYPTKNNGGKPPIYRKCSKDFDNIDPLTGKRRYTRRKQNYYYDDEDDETPFNMHLSDTGVWRPTDDLRLIVNMIKTGNLESVHTGVTFSCFFTLRDIEERWRKLLYGEKSCMVAQNAISALHPDVKAKIYHESLFSADEEKLIASVKQLPNSNPDINSFQKLVDENPHIFGKYRTARCLMMHWLNMKDFHLLEQQSVLDYDPQLNFEDMEEVICEEVVVDSDEDVIEDEAIDLELKTEERLLKKRMILLEDEITAWQMLTNQIIEDGMKNRSLPPTDFDSKTFALIRGREVYYGMTSREIILGRSTKECKVDADLTEEGCSSKISRKQAIIRLKDMGKFSIINKGKATIFVDRKAVPYRCAATLRDQSLIQIAQINLIFFVNKTIMSHLIESDVSREIYASFKDLLDLPSPSIRPFSPFTTRSPFFLKARNVQVDSNENVDVVEESVLPPDSYVTIN